MPASARLLVIDDEPMVREVVTRYLEQDGHRVTVAPDGATALRELARGTFDLIVLDLMLPAVDGFSVLREVRLAGPTPVIVLTARGDEADRIRGLQEGADDYVVKPFSPRELVERVRAILRRYEAPAPAPTTDTAPETAPPVLRVGDLELDPGRYRVTRSGEEIELTRVEFRLLQALMSAPGRVQTREGLLARVYDDEPDVIDRVIDIHVGKLRRKLEHDPSSPTLIRTVRGVGYRLDEEGDGP